MDPIKFMVLKIEVLTPLLLRQVETKLQKQARESGTAFDAGELQLSSGIQEATLTELPEDQDPGREADPREDSTGNIQQQDKAAEKASIDRHVGSEDSVGGLSESEKLMAGLAEQAEDFHRPRSKHDPTEL